MIGGTTQSENHELTRVLVVGNGQVAERVADHDEFDSLTEQTVGGALTRLACERVDCVIVTLQGESQELLRGLREVDQTPPGLVVVAEDSETTMGEALEFGAADVISDAQIDEDGALLGRRIRNVIARQRGAEESSMDRQGSEATAGDPPLDRSSDVALFEAVNSPVAYVEYVDDRPRIRDVNPAFAETFGVDESGVVGMDIHDIVVSPKRRMEAAQLSERFREGDLEAVEVVRNTADGPWPFLLRLAPVGDDTDRLFVTYLDISERKRREEELEELNNRISSLHEAANRLLTAESESAVCEETVRAAIDILNFDWCVTSCPEDGWFELTAASEDTPFEVGDTPLAVGEGTSGRAFETGETDLTNDMLADSQGAPADDAIRSGLTVPIGKFGIFQAVSTEPGAFDETDRELAELLVAHTQEALHWFERTEELERQNERLEQFASVVSHDLRNPLNIAQGRLTLARETEDLSQLEATEQALDRMNSIVDDVLALAQGDPSIEPEPVRLETTAETAWSMVSTDGASLVVDAEGDRLADPGRLQRLFENLFRNSIEHGDAETVRVEALEGGFAVVDEGTGFADTENVLESGKSTDGGTGLGLAIVERIANAHDWSISAENCDSGARIEIHGVERAS